MISCTEFIPSYSELFSYLDKQFGKEEVEKFWAYLFKPHGKGIPLINFLKKDGLRGAWNYWAGTLKEEAADCKRYFNEKEGWIYSETIYCPSKGRLLQLEKELGIKPYPHYCDHCDYYRASLEKEGLKYIRFHMGVENAQCRALIYDPKIFKGFVNMSDDVEILEISSANTEYFHRDFHSSLNMGIDYLGRVHGEKHLVEYLKTYTENVCKKVIDSMPKVGALEAIKNKIVDTYTLEKALEVLTINQTENLLEVKIAYCPAVKHLKDTGREVSKYFSYATSVVMQTLAEKGGLSFEMTSYDEETGATEYKFFR